MVATPQKYRNPRKGFYTDLYVDTTPVGSIVNNLKAGQNSFDHNYINASSNPHRHAETVGDAYQLGDDPAYTHEGYLYCNGDEHYIRDYPALFQIIGNDYGGSASNGIDITFEGMVKTFTSNATYNANRPAGTYLVQGVTLTGNGSGAWFKVVVPASGTSIPTITLDFAGKGYTVGDTINLPNDKMGKAGGVPDIVITVASIEGGGGSGYTVNSVVSIGAPAGVVWSNFLSPTVPTQTSAGFSKNDGTEWSSNLTATSGFESANPASKAFDGSLTTFAQSTGTGTSANIEITGITTVYDPDSIQVYVEGGGSATDKWDISGTNVTTVETNASIGWQTVITTGILSNIKVTAKAAGQKAKLTAIRVNDITLVDNQDDDTKALGFDANANAGKAQSRGIFTFTPPTAIDLKSADKLQVIDDNTNTRSRVYATGPIIFSNYLSAGVDGQPGATFDPNWVQGTAPSTVGGTGPGGEHILKDATSGFDSNNATPTGRTVGEFGLLLDLPVPIKLGVGDKVQVYDTVGTSNTRSRAYYGTSWSSYTNHGTGWTTILTGTASVQDVSKIYAVRYDAGGRDAGWMGIRIEDSTGAFTYFQDGTLPYNYSVTDYALGTKGAWVTHVANTYTTIKTGSGTVTKFVKLETERTDIEDNNVPGTGVNSSTNVWSIGSHGCFTGDRIQYFNAPKQTGANAQNGGAIPGLTNGQIYWISKVNNNDVRLHTSKADALAVSNPVNFTGGGSTYQGNTVRYLDKQAGVMGVRVEPGSGGATPFIDGNLPPNPATGNVTAQAEVAEVDANGKILKINVTNYGSGYTTTPTVSVSGGTGALLVARINTAGTLQAITQVNVMEYYGDLYMGTFKVPDMITKKVVGNGPVYGNNSPNIGNSSLGVGTTGGKWYLDKTLQDDYFSLGRIVTTGYDNVTETVSASIIGQHTVKFTMREEDLDGPPNHTHAVYSSIPTTETQITKAGSDRYLYRYKEATGKVKNWSPTDEGTKLKHKHGLVRRPNPDASVATYDVLDAWGGAGSCGTIQNPEKVLSVASASINTGTDAINIPSHGLSTKSQIKYVQSTGGAIGNLVDGTTYYVYTVDANFIKLCTTQANAEATPVVAIDLTGTPSGSYQFIIDMPIAEQNYLATGSGGTYQFVTTVPAPTFRKFITASEIGARKVLVNEGQPIVEYNTTWEQTTAGSGSSINFPSNCTHMEYTVLGGGGGGASGTVVGSDGSESWMQLGNGSVLKLTAGGGKKGEAASTNAGGQGGQGGAATKTGTGDTPTGQFAGQNGGMGSGSKLTVGPPDNQTTDPQTGGAGGTSVGASAGAGGSGINVKIGESATDVNVNPNSAGAFDFSFIGAGTITALSFTISGGEGGTAANISGHPGNPDAMPGGKGTTVSATMLTDPATLALAKTKSWILVKGEAGGVEGGASIRDGGDGIGSSAVSSQKGGTGGYGSTAPSGYIDPSTRTNGAGGGASTRLQASGELVLGAGGGGGGGCHGHNTNDVGTTGRDAPTGATGYTTLAVDSGSNAAAAGCIGGGGGGGGAGIGPGNAGGSDGGSGDADGGGGSGGHAGGVGGQAGCSGWATGWFASGTASYSNSGNGTGFATISYDNSYWTAGGGGGGAGGLWGPAIIELANYSNPTSFQMHCGSGGSGGSIPANGQGTPNAGQIGYVKVRGGIKVGESGATYRISTGDIIESASKTDEIWDVEIVDDSTGVGNGNGTFKLPTTQVPKVIFRGGGLPDGDARHAEATCTVLGGKVTGVALTNGGSDYTEAPVVHIVHGAGGGAYATAAIDSTSGAVNNLQFDASQCYTFTRYLKFGNHHANTATTDRNRWVVLTAQDTSNVDLFSIKCCRGNTRNGGDDSENVLRVSYQISGQTGWTLMDPIITPTAQRLTDPILKSAKVVADRSVPAVDVTTTTNNYDGDSGDTQWYTYTVGVPAAAQSTATKFKVEQPMPNPTGSNDTDDDKQHFGIAEFIYWRPKTSGLVFVPNAGAVSKPAVDELSYTIEGPSGGNVTYSSGLNAGDATITLKRTTKIEPVASIDPDKHIPLIHTYKTCKYLIKAY